MNALRRHAAILILLLAAIWHAVAVWSEWTESRGAKGGQDFASYYFALRAAADGDNPYSMRAIRTAAMKERRVARVHPFFYPPPFLLSVVWALPLDVTASYRVWFWLDELAAILCAIALWRWWRELGPAVPAVLAAAVATLTAIPNNHAMGQMNLPVLALVLAGLWQEERGRSRLGGALVGAACMMKMSPALFVAWWMLRGRWTAVLAACATAVAASVLVLPLVGPTAQVDFYTRVLPGFSSGDYNGLTVPIGLFGNHSVPDVIDRLLPGSGASLSGVARALSTATALVIVGGLALAFRREPADAWARWAQVSAVAVAMLLVPVYTYEHHLVWALPAVVLVACAVLAGRVPRWWAVVLAIAWFAWAFDLQILKGAWEEVRREHALLGEILRELKFASLLALFGLSVALGRERGEPKVANPV